jgi:hypothetical protein
MERCLWWKLLEVGRQLMQLFFAARREAAEEGRQVERDGEVYPYIHYRTLFEISG